MLAGTGEMRLTQYELSLGVSTGTGIMRRRSPRRWAYRSIIWPSDQRVRPAGQQRDLPMVQRPDEVGQRVGDPDRLAAGGHPAWRDHHGQALGQVAQDLERRAPGPDHDRGPELRDGDAVASELGAHVVPAGEMVGPLALSSPRPPR